MEFTGLVQVQMSPQGRTLRRHSNRRLDVQTLQCEVLPHGIMASIPETLLNAPADVVSQLRALALSGSETHHELHARLREMGIVKLGHRLKAVSVLTATVTEDVRPPPYTPTPTAPRVAIIAHTGYFKSSSFGGATRASLALIREARRICGTPAEGGGGLDVIAVSQTPVPETLVFKLEDDRLGELTWEGEHILCGRRERLVRALSERSYDVLISLSIEESMLQLAFALRATVRYATPHNYYLPPFGPFKRFEVKPGHPEMLGRLDALLSPCEHHCDFLRRWSPVPLVTRPLFAADYHCAPTRNAARLSHLSELFLPIGWQTCSVLARLDSRRNRLSWRRGR